MHDEYWRGYMLSSASLRTALRSAFPDQPGTARDAALAAASGAAVLLASLANFLAYNGYPMLRPEVGIVAAALIAAAALAGVLYYHGGRLGRIGLAALLAYLAFDFNFEGNIVVLLTLALVLVARSRTVPLLGIASTVVLATELISAATGTRVAATEAAARADAPRIEEASDLPPLFHIVLDEHIGVEGLLGGGSAAMMREKLKSFYTGHGFRLFGGAYSSYFHTINSMPHLFNFSNVTIEDDASREKLLARNAYFARLERLGYRIEVLQTDFIDFCRSPSVDACSTVSDVGLDSAADAGLPLSRRVDLVGSAFASMSSIVSKSLTAYDSSVDMLARIGLDLPKAYVMKLRLRTSAIAALERLDHLADIAREARPGTAYFAHVLFPHDPYSVDADCTPRDGEWLTRRHNVGRQTVWDAYDDQVSCAMSKLDQIMRNLDAAAGPGKAIVIVHGDHGARTEATDPSIENRAVLRDQDLIRGFSTLFAVRARGIAAGYDPDRVPVGTLLDAVSDTGFKDVVIPKPGARDHFVTLADDTARPSDIRLPLPEWWISGM